MATRLPRKSKPSIAPVDPPGGLVVARGIVKTLSILVGGSFTFLCAMALFGRIVDSGWIRGLVTGLGMLLLPAVVVDRILPEKADARARGLTSDVFSLAWLGTALLLTVGLHDWTSAPLREEGDRLQKSGYARWARVSYLLAGVALEPRKQGAQATQPARKTKDGSPESR
jgi:serine protease Do